MSVYFLYQSAGGAALMKIGRAKDICRRRDVLQTGNPHPLLIVGWIESTCDHALEKALHRKYGDRRSSGEWFHLEPSEILEDLKRAGSDGFVARNADAFEITGYDRDAVPEYLGVWEWADLELDECCPFCGSLCGLHLQGVSHMYHCISCGRLSDFSEHEPQFESEEEYLAWRAGELAQPPRGMERFVILGGVPDVPRHLRRGRQRTRAKSR